MAPDEQTDDTAADTEATDAAAADVAGDDTPATAEDAATGDTPENAPEDSGPAPTPEYEELAARIDELLGDDVIEAADNHGDYVVRVRNEAWRRAAEVARADLDCQFLSFVSGVDWAPTPREGGDAPSAPVQPQETAPGVAGGTGRFQAFAHVQSTARHWGVTFKTDLDENDPRVASWVDVYPGADWHERECREMYGFTFDGHPALKALYLPAEFEGHPLRKDFPLLARTIKPWPGLVDVEDVPAGPEDEASGETADASSDSSDSSDSSESSDSDGGDT